MRQRIQALLLCSIAIVLLALLTGIILKSRERSQNMVCSQQLKNLAQATHRYHDDHKCLPPGYVGPWPDRPGVARAPNVGVLVYLLPYLTKDSKQWETPYYQTNLEALTDPEDKAKQYPIAADAPWWTLVNPENSIYNLQLAQQHFDFLACPSMKQLEPREGLIVALHSYGKEVYLEGFLDCHILTRGDALAATTSGFTHYLGVAGRFGRGDQFEGVFGNRTKLRLEQITVKDGTSSTLAFGEACGGMDNTGAFRNTAYSWFCGSLPTYYGLSEPPAMSWKGFNGPHPDSVKFAMVDGSVRSFLRRGDQQAEVTDDGTPRTWKMNGDSTQPDSLRWRWLQSLAGYRDGIMLDPLSTVD